MGVGIKSPEQIAVTMIKAGGNNHAIARAVCVDQSTTRAGVISTSSAVTRSFGFLMSFKSSRGAL